MKKQLLTAFFFIAFMIPFAKAQYVTIPDPEMVNMLTIMYPTAMSGNQMDTTNWDIVNATYLNLSPGQIDNVFGIQFFDNCEMLVLLDMGISIIPSLPPNLIDLNVNNNSLSSLPILPNTLMYLSCYYNQLTSLPNLPNSLLYLDCSNNNLSNISFLPSNLEALDCSYNQLTDLPALPQTLNSLRCFTNSLVELPILPDSLNILECGTNNLTILPDLPNSLTMLSCGFNQLTTLPNLPDSLLELSAVSNNLSSIPELPNILIMLDVQLNSNLFCLPIIPESVMFLYATLSGINCYPNQPNPQCAYTNFPICQTYNPNSCITTNSISGAAFNDFNDNCINIENLNLNSSFQLYDEQNIFLQSRSLTVSNNYYFTIQPGEYIVRVDSSYFTNGVAITCPLSGQHNVTALPDSSYTDRDFGIACLGIDLGVEAISHQGIVFPGQPHSVKALAGDLSNYFGLNCASGTGGTVQISVSGPITYTGTSGNALVPTISGNTYSYSISDFGTTNVQESFVLDFLTETTAQSGNLVTVTVTITSNGTDLDATNNVLTYTYIVVNSYDPNMKEVNPVDVLPGYEDYFTYTVHFQNLGTAPAFNINIKDTLDSNLDFSTFRVINASHDYSYNLAGDLLTVYFQNIMLADSASNPEGSKGFVQYQVKPKSNLPLGTSIENTAHIFFDFNEAVVTNTTVNNFVEELLIAEITENAFMIYPNPSNGNITIVNQNGGNESLNIEIYDLLGKKLVSESLSFKNGSSNMSLSLAAGTYLVSIGDNSQIQRLQIRD